SGFGREGGIEGLREYLKRKHDWAAGPPPIVEEPSAAALLTVPSEAIDRTPKNFIGGEQKRPDGGATRVILSKRGLYAGRAPNSDRKDIRDAVEAADRAQGWPRMSAHARAQVLYYIAENISARDAEFATQLAGLTGVSRREAQKEVAASLS